MQTISRNSSFGRASAFQAEGGGFEPRFLLQLHSLHRNKNELCSEGSNMKFSTGLVLGVCKEWLEPTVPD